jgi:hypothetical protein
MTYQFILIFVCDLVAGPSWNFSGLGFLRG